MVGLRKLYISLIVSLLALPLVAQNTLGGFAERQMRQLSLRAESTLSLLERVRAEYATAPNDSLARVIHELEKQSQAIQNALARISEAQVQEEGQAEKVVKDDATESVEEVAKEVSEPIQEPISTPEIAQESAPEIPPTEEVAKVEEETTPTPSSEEVVTNEAIEQEATTIVEEENTTIAEEPVSELIVSEELKSLFNTSRRRYALTQNELDTLVVSYEATYKTIAVALNGYDQATSLKTLEGHYADYLNAVEKLGKIANEIANRSDQMLTSKMEAYFGFADSLGIDTLRAHHTRKMEGMESTLSEKLAGKCTDLDLAMYPHRLRATMFLEADLARHIEPEIADSLLLMAKNHDCTHTLFAPYGAPKRADAKFSAITIKKKTKERPVSSLPVLKIPAEGELYSITVANYASLPPSTKVFRGATPLYREQREDGRTYIYLGMYPTARSAKEDIALLRKAGFKQPTLVMWRDGIRRDDWVERNTSTAPKTAMYRIEIAGVEGSMPESVMSIIKEKAPRKEISKYTSSDGEVIYTLGIFTKQSEAQAIATAIAKALPSLTATITQVGKR